MKRKTLSASKRFRIFQKCKFACAYCGAKAPDVQLHIDHVRPFSGFGEPPSLDGYTSACADCNLGKGSRDFVTGRNCTPNLKLQDGDVVEAQARIEKGEPPGKVAAEYGVTKQALLYRRTMLGLPRRTWNRKLPQQIRSDFSLSSAWGF